MANKFGDDRSNHTIAFLSEVVQVCKKYGLSLGHEDAQGSFIVEPWSESGDVWIMDASEDDEVNS